MVSGEGNKEMKITGLTTAGLLGIVFVTLKLCGVIDWSWWWVTAPFWGMFAIAAGLLIIVGVSIGIYSISAAVVNYYKRGC